MANPAPVTYSAPDGVIRGGRWWHALAQFAATVQPGQCVEFPAPNLNSYDEIEGYWFGPTPSEPAAIGPMDQAWASCMDLDPATQQWHFAGGRPESAAWVQKMLWNNARTNEWRSKSNWSGIRGGHMYRSTCTIPDHRLVVYEPAYLTDGVLPLWNLDTNTYAGTIPSCPTNIAGGTSGWGVGQALVWHPRMGAQGSIVRASSSLDRLTVFDWATQEWIGIGRFDAPPGWTNPHQTGHYNRFTREVIIGSGTVSSPGALTIIAANKSTRLAALTPCNVAANSQSQFVPHPTRSASIVVCQITGRIWSYEWDADTWIDRAELPVSLVSANIHAGTHDQLGIILFAKYGSSGNSKTYIYRPEF